MSGFGFSFSPQLGTLLNLSPPTLLSASSISDAQINLIWTVGDETKSHRIYISTDNVGFTEKGTVDAGINTYSATSLTDGTIYYFKIVSFLGARESVSSNTADACTIPTKFISENVIFWYDYTDPALKTVSGGRVSQVNDKSANSYHQIQGNSNQQPYDLGALGIQGKGGQRIGNTTALGVDGNNTVFIVARIDTFENSKLILSGVSATDSTLTKIIQSGWNPIKVDAPEDGIWFLLTSIVNNSGTDILQINNDAEITGTTNQHQIPVSNILGHANDTGFLKGTIASAICLNEILGATDITKAKTYLNWKYQVFFLTYSLDENTELNDNTYF